MNKYTIEQFRKDYPDNDACLDKLFKLRYTNLVCPKCDNDTPFKRVKDRKSYQCTCCGFQVYPMEGTIFEKSTTPLIHWYYAIFLQTTTRNGVSAKELERSLNICYKTALRMNHQIKRLIGKGNNEKLTGIVEIDESYLKMLIDEDEKIPTETTNEKSDNIRGIMGFVSREGKVRTQVMHGGKSFKERVRENVSKDATIFTDGHKGYEGLSIEYFKHEIVNHFAGEYVRGEVHIQSAENFWSILKRTIKGTHLSVSEKYLQLYADEVAFRYMHRKEQATMFETILKNVV